MKKIKVAFFIDVLREHFDGVSNTMHQLIKRIPKDRIEPIFITPMVPDKDIGFPVYECPYIQIPVNKGYRMALPKRMKNLAQILDDFEPDIVHWSSPSLLGAYAIKYAKKRDLPISTIYHTHFPTYADYYLGFIPKLEKLTSPIAKQMMKGYKNSSVISAPTKTMRSYLLKMGIPEDQVKIWGRGVELDRFSPNFRDIRFFDKYRACNTKKLLFVSRLVKEKETNTLIRLHHLLKENRPDLSLVITGDGPDRRRMEKNMPNAIFTGKLTGIDLATAYASADVFVFPSITETFGNVVLEAMASGLPVVAADAGGPSDIIQHEKTGLLIKPKDENAFYNAVATLIDDKNKTLRIQSAAHRYAVNQDWEQLSEVLFKRLEDLASSAGEAESLVFAST